jgi:hypothetical protein
MAFVLQDGVTITCPHGGSASVTASTTDVTLGGKAVLVVNDVTTVSGCAFNISGSPSPCMKVAWQMPATKVKAGGQAVLLSSSIALCNSAAGAPQGPATVTGFQTKVSAQ